MKAVKKNTSVIRHYHISLMVFLLALGLTPASLMSNGASANTETVTEKASNVADTPKIKGENTVSEVKIAEISEEYAEDTEEVGEEYEVYTEPAPVEVVQEEVAYTAPVVYDQINIAGNTIPIFYSSDTMIDAGHQAALYGNHFIYGHNTADVFGGLAGMRIGDYFTVTLDGVTRTYQVVNSDLRTKKHFEGDIIRRTNVSGMTVLTKMKIMKAITAYGEYNGGHYDYILMTCAGTSYGNGDASHRLILMANQV